MNLKKYINIIIRKCIQEKKKKKQKQAIKINFDLFEFIKIQTKLKTVE